MEQISNFFKSLGERLSSPLLYSFFFAWLIINWKIPTGIILYNSSSIITVGYNSFFVFITEHLNTINTFIKPLSIAIIYTFGYPFVKNCIHAFNVWIKTWGNRWNLNLAKEGKISVEQYIKLTESYKKRSELLETVLDNESKNLRELLELQNQTLQITTDKNNIYQELSKWKTMADINQIEGEWELQYTTKVDNPIHLIRIRHGVLEFMDPPPKDIGSQIQIKQFYRHPDMSYLTLTTFVLDKDRNGSYHFFRLEILNDMKLLRGLEDDKYKVELRKK